MRVSSKFAVLVTALLMAIVVTACGGGASSTSGSGSTGGGAAATGDPAKVAKDFLTAVFSGNDINAYLCTTNAAAAKAIAQGMDSMKQALAASGAKISTEKLTFDAGTVSGDSASVKVGGKLTTTVAGTSTDVDYSGAAIPLKNESGSWKVCG